MVDKKLEGMNNAMVAIYTAIYDILKPIGDLMVGIWESLPEEVQEFMTQIAEIREKSLKSQVLRLLEKLDPVYKICGVITDGYILKADLYKVMSEIKKLLE